jgi:6-pyruvoyltetrahydropterin/6-carboxytetrahydropterin synthase
MRCRPLSFDIPRKAQILGEDIYPEQLQYHRKRVRVSKEFTFDSAHHLHMYEGKCKSLHGHTYKLQLVMLGAADERGLVIDFADIKRIARERVVKRIDHRYLNEVLPPMNTTAENMVVWIYEEIEQALREEGWFPRVILEEVRLWETPTSYASITKDLMEERTNE